MLLVKVQKSFILYHYTTSLFLSVKPQESNPQQTVIPREALELGKELGVGEFGSVLKGVWNNPNGQKVFIFLLLLRYKSVLICPT